MRANLAQHRLQVLLVVAAAVVVAAVVFVRLPRPVSAVGVLDQCLWGWPVVEFEGEDWKAALPGDLRTYAPGYIPIADWPNGLRFDEQAGLLLDADGDPLFHKGDRMRIKGSIVEVHGDPSPCFYTLGVKVDEIASP